MPGKQLDITIKGKDEISNSIRTIVAALDQTGAAAAAGDKKAGSFWNTLKNVVGVTAVLGAVRGAFDGVKGAITSVVDEADRLDDIADRAKGLGVTATTLSEISYTADLAGVSAEELTSAFAKLEKNVSQFARTGKGKAADAILALGVSFTDSNGEIRKAEDLLYDYLDALSKVPNEVTRVEYAQRIFGNERVLQFAADGGASLRRYAAEARVLGASITASQAEAGGAVSDAVKRVEYAWRGLKTRLVEEIGPGIATVANQIAGDIAAIPDIVKSIKDTVANAYAGDSEAQAKLSAFWTAVQNLAEVGSLSVWRVVRAGANVGWGIVSGYLTSGIDALFDTVANKAPYYAKKIGAAFLPALSKNTLGLIGVSDAISNEFGLSLKDEADASIRDIEAKARGVRLANRSGSDASISRELSGASSDWAEFNRVLADARSQVAGAGKDVIVTGDAIGQVSAALQRHDLSVAVNGGASRAAIGDTAKASDDWDQFLGGVDAGLEQLRQKADDVRSFGASSITTVADSLSGGLTNALFDTATGVKSLGQAFREFGKEFFAQIAKMIAQYLLFKAIIGITSAVVSAGVSSYQPASVIDAASISPDQTPGFFSDLATSGGSSSTGFFSDLGNSGLIDTNVPRFASGGIVGGGGIVSGSRAGKDTVLAALAGGEGVLKPGAVNRNPGVVDFLNSGGQVQAAGGGGGGVVIQSLTVNVNTGSNGQLSRADARKAAETMVDAILEAFGRSPGKREQFKGTLGIA